MTDQKLSGQSNRRHVVDVDVTYHFRVDVTDWLDDVPMAYRGPTADELRRAAEGTMEYHYAAQGEGRECVGYTIKARV